MPTGDARAKIFDGLALTKRTWKNPPPAGQKYLILDDDELAKLMHPDGGKSIILTSNNPWAALFAARAGLVATARGITFNSDAVWEGEDLVRIGSQVGGTGTVTQATAYNGGVIDIASGTSFALACPQVVGGVAPVWVKNCKTQPFYVETRAWITGAPAGTARCALVGMWTGGAAPNSSSLISFGVSPFDPGSGAFSRLVLSMWDGAQWNEVGSTTTLADIANPHAYALFSDGITIFAFVDGALVAFGSVSGLGGSPSAGNAWTVTSQNQNGLHTFLDTVYAATVRG